MTATKKTSALIEKIKELKTMMQEQGETEILKMFTEFFENHPKAKAIRWRQYAPYFNDGDVCEFSVHDMYAKIVGGPEDEAGDYDDGFLDASDTKSLGLEVDETLFSDLREISTLASNVLEEVFQLVFGDDTMVTINRNGTIEKDDYDHD